MDVRQLGVFLAVASERNFTRAAARLNTAQSAVSATIRALEAEFATELFDRSLRQIELTEAGQALVPRARAVLDSVAEARDAVDAVSGGVTGTVAVGMMTSVTIVDVPRLLADFALRHPEVRVTMRPSPRGTAGLIEMLEAGELDVAFVGNAPAQGRLRIDVLNSSPLVLAVPPGHPLATRGSVTLAELAAQPFVDSPLGFGNRSAVDQAFEQRGVSRDVRFETADIADAAALVSNGLGVAFLPASLASATPGLVTLTVDDEELRLVVSVAVSGTRRLGRAAQGLWQLALERYSLDASPR